MTMINPYFQLENITTPEFTSLRSFEDADEELLPIANFIKEKTIHNADIETDRIKFLYCDKPKKDGNSYVTGVLMKRNDFEKMINDDYDYIIFVYYKVWKELDIENKVIQLDKILCGIDLGTMESPKLAKKQTDSREYFCNMKYFGAEKVLNSSEAVHLATERMLEKEKEEKRNHKKRNKEEDEINE